MDATPHTHTPKIELRYPGIAIGPWELTYGDTVVRICREGREPAEKDIRRALALAVKQHDNGSRQAGDLVNRKGLATSLVAAVPKGEWASDHIKQERRWHLH